MEQPGSRQSKPAALNILSRPSASACSLTRPEPGTIIAETFAFEAEDTASLRREPEAAGILIGFDAAFDRPAGILALTGANVITMRGDEVIRNATIVIDGNRIMAVGPAAQVTIPADAHVVDVSGRWITPGLVDVHAHRLEMRQEPCVLIAGDAAEDVIALRSLLDVGWRVQRGVAGRIDRRIGRLVSGALCGRVAMIAASLV